MLFRRRRRRLDVRPGTTRHHDNLSICVMSSLPVLSHDSAVASISNARGGGSRNSGGGSISVYSFCNLWYCQRSAPPRSSSRPAPTTINCKGRNQITSARLMYANLRCPACLPITAVYGGRSIPLPTSPPPQARRFIFKKYSNDVNYFVYPTLCRQCNILSRHHLSSILSYQASF